MDWFLYDIGLHHERVKITIILGLYFTDKWRVLFLSKKVTNIWSGVFIIHFEEM